MSKNFSIKGVTDEVADRLRLRAARNHRSLQGELMAIIEQAAGAPESVAAGGHRSALHHGWKTVEDLVAERRAMARAPDLDLPLGVDIIRADRDSR